MKPVVPKISPAETTSVVSDAARATSPLSSLCSGVLEASWLTAVAVVPCLYNPYAEHNFGPEKAALLHGLGLLIAGAWLVRLVLERREGKSGSLWASERSVWRQPLAWPLAALLLGYLVSTC